MLRAAGRSGLRKQLAAAVLIGAAALVLLAATLPARSPARQAAPPSPVQVPSARPAASLIASSEATHPRPLRGGKTLVVRDGETLTGALLRAGAGGLDAALADRLFHDAGAGVAAGSSMVLVLGAPLPGGARRIEAAEFRPYLGLTLRLHASGDELRLERSEVAVDSTPVRVRGLVGAGLAATLGNMGLPAQIAHAAETRFRSERGELFATDAFDLIVAARRTASGEREFGALLYAGLDRASGRDIQLVRLHDAASGEMIDAAAEPAQIAQRAIVRPVDGIVTSGFGWRFHPVLRFPRFHRGIDIAARWGTPVRAAAAGTVASAGWAGGYGYQVRLAHPDGTTTSYSHLARIAVEPGRFVEAGAAIGAVGSTGLSTGPHLHFEMRRGGTLVSPTFGANAAAPAHTPAEVARAREVLRTLLSHEYRDSAA